MGAKRVSFLLSFLVVGLLGTGVARADLVGWWTLDGNVLDSSGHGNHGTTHGAVPWAAGKIGGALSLDGSTGYVTVPFSESLRVINRGDGFTLTAWFNLRTLPVENKIIFQQGDLNGTGRTWLQVTTAADLSSSLGGAGGTVAGMSVEANTWYHGAVVVTEGGTADKVQLYLNGRPAGAAATKNVENCEGIFYLGRHKNSQNYWNGLLDDLRVYDRPLSPAEVRQVVERGLFQGAVNPSPAEGATDVGRDTTLGWSPGKFPGTYDVYFGTVFADVNTAARANPMGLLASQGQAGTACDPGRLALGTTYYWRVDEVNASPDATLFRGEIWSFTTEPEAYLVDGGTITVTASSADPAQGPQNTVNGSGLTGEKHGNDLTTMWVTAPGLVGPAWIQYEFDLPLELHEMWVWNHNGLMETTLGLGAKDVTVEYSIDGTVFQTLGTTHEFARALGQSDYAHNTTIAFGDVAVKIVKLTIHSNWGGLLLQYGLSEVHFFAVPVYARQPSPAPGAADLVVETPLNWRAGREAASHQVFLGTDPNHLTLAATVQTPAYEPPLDLDQTYYWKIVEVNEAETPASWPSEVWSFSTQPYVVIDDFESYTNNEGEAIFQTWPDGLENPANGGSQVGNDPAPYAEQAIVHGGSQSMPLFYGQTAGATYSETTRTFDTPQNWTAHGIKSLSLWFRGIAGNTGQLYVKVSGTKTAYNGEAANLAVPTWQVWNIDLSKAGQLNSVRTLTIGIEGTGAKGTLYFDDIRLYPKVPEYITPAQPAATNLAAHYTFDEGTGTKVGDSSGNGNHGTTNGTVQWTAGKIGGALAFDGSTGYVTVPFSESLRVMNRGDGFTLTAWFNARTLPVENKIIFQQGDLNGTGRTWLQVSAVADVSSSLGNIGTVAGVSVEANTWYHAAVVVTEGGTADTVQLYLNGRPARAGAARNVENSEGIIYLGRHKNPQNYWNGLLDDVRVYSRPLSPAEVGALAGLTAPYDKPF